MNRFPGSRNRWELKPVSRFPTYRWEPYPEPEPSQAGNHTPACPGCGGEVTITGRVYCRPSCRARAEWRDGRERPRQLFGGLTLDNELPEATPRTTWQTWRGERDDLLFLEDGARNK